jgi:hypothetical protein
LEARRVILRATIALLPGVSAVGVTPAAYVNLRTKRLMFPRQNKTSAFRLVCNIPILTALQALLS